MKKNIMLIFACALLLFSCKDKNTYDPTSLTGGWQCQEQGSLSQPRNYPVNIERDPIAIDTSTYLIHNFYKTGFETDVYFSSKDNVIEIPSQGIEGIDGISQYRISGHGKISSDLKSIELKYEVTIYEGIDYVNSIYTRN